jgi:hypothetical protein
MMLYLQVPDLLARYGARGFGVTIVEKTKGRAVNSGLLPPAAQADSMAWFLRTYHQLPVTLGVIQSKVHELVPLPDGRHAFIDTTPIGLFRHQRYVEKNPDRAEEHEFDPPLALLYGRDGTLLYAGVGNLGLPFPLLNALIKRAVAAP